MICSRCECGAPRIWLINLDLHTRAARQNGAILLPNAHSLGHPIFAHSQKVHTHFVKHQGCLEKTPKRETGTFIRLGTKQPLLARSKQDSTCHSLSCHFAAHNRFCHNLIKRRKKRSQVSLVSFTWKHSFCFKFVVA